jgi:NAD(P)-dependent dehydrogenase (short-subunit alcohol dehydrogenase family)
MRLLRRGLTLDPHHVIEVSALGASAASGQLAERLTAGFLEAQARGIELADGGCIVFEIDGDESLRAGISALVRSLALEWAARGIRVNAVCKESGPELIRFIASPAGRMLTGVVL